MTDPVTDKDVYLQSLLLIERLHRRLLDVLKAELDRIGRGDINNVQALILYNIGDDELTVGELTYRGYYLGSNVSYNVKKLVEHDYLRQERSQHDRRSVRVKLSDKGKALRDEVNELFERQIGRLFQPNGLPRDQVAAMNETLRKLERFWSAEVQFGG